MLLFNKKIKNSIILEKDKNEKIEYGNSSSGQLSGYFGIDISGHIHNADFDTFSLYKSVKLFKDKVVNYLY